MGLFHDPEWGNCQTKSAILQMTFIFCPAAYASKLATHSEQKNALLTKRIFFAEEMGLFHDPEWGNCQTKSAILQMTFIFCPTCLRK
jgi:hypothetical protein